MARPNIVLFMPDQLRADGVGAFGNPAVQTPNIDALARRGTRFSNAFVNHPVCSPSRVNLLTGWYPHTRGHRTLSHLVQPWEPNLLKYFKDSGYHVAWVGQRGDMFAPGVTEASTHFHGWTIRPQRSQMGMGPQHPDGSALYNAFYHGRRPGTEPWLDFDEATIRTAEAWLAERPAGPWLLLVALIFPHLPFEVEEPFYSLHAPADMPPPVPADPDAGKPRFHALIRDKLGTSRLSPDDWAEIVRVYYGMIARVDHQLGRIVRAVDVIGETDRTAVFFFTDHGEYAGDFGLVEKWPSGLDVCLTRNPLIAQVPNGLEGNVCDTFVEMVDLLPTLLELGGIEPAHTHFGRSLVEALRRRNVEVRDRAFSEGGFAVSDVHLFETPTGEYRRKGELQHEHPRAVGKAVAMRTADYTYVYRHYEADELYDRRADPAETLNLAGRPELADLQQRLKLELLEWLMDTSDVIPWQADPRFPEVPNGEHDPFTP